jgi:putative ABC transport system ATP-binding protein
VTGRAVTGSSARGVAVRAESLVHIYAGDDEDVVALRGVDLAVAPGETLALFGPSGSGKSTLLAVCAGLVRPSAGRVLVDDVDLGRLAPRDLAAWRRTTVGVVLQGARRNLLAWATPAENLRFVQALAPRSAPRDGTAPVAPAPDDLIGELGLSRVATSPVRALSDGEAQRVALAAAVATRPGLLVADEPTSQLDRASRAAVLELLLRINRVFGTTVLVVTHDAEVGAALHRTVGMRDGVVGSEGLAGEPLTTVTRDGAVPLPDDVLERWPPGTRVRVVADGDEIVVRRLP